MTSVEQQFQTLTAEELMDVNGGKNNWQMNVLEGGSALVSGWGLGVAVCAATGVGAAWAPACGYIGAKFGGALWAGVTAATGGF
ncbi:Bacteriocin-like peptide M BlpM [Streptococcus sp. DD10]|uniref:bacteriocin n=1 Tax=Streptococcus sp. DD10 TaxID=1777878 RepID=UPI000793E726|nr:bacteriocin [Streptococcus sp. DD10]KXT74290.1 Bacteriocin-like peptide M BlpM [Streptococcus sp. DD10]